MISVIVSNFNGLRFLPKLLASLRAQRGVALELIIVDRQSTDDSGAFLAAQPDVRVITEPPQSGLVTGYHAGTCVAKGDLFFFANEDLWRKLDELAIQHEIKYTRVAGHSGHPENDRCDELAVEAAAKFK